MASRQRVFTPSFDRDAEYVVSRPFRINGVDHRPGKPFNKAQVSERRLRQLFDARRLTMTSAPRRVSGLADLRSSGIKAEAALAAIQEQRAMPAHIPPRRPNPPEVMNGAPEPDPVATEEPQAEVEVDEGPDVLGEKSRTYDPQDFLNFDNDQKATAPAQAVHEAKLRARAPAKKKKAKRRSRK